MVWRVGVAARPGEESVALAVVVIYTRAGHCFMCALMCCALMAFLSPDILFCVECLERARAIQVCWPACADRASDRRVLRLGC